MTELDRFEARFAGAYARYVAEVPTEVDAAAVARQVACARQRRWAMTQGLPSRVVWLLAGLAILGLASAVAVGAWLLTVRNVPNLGLTIVAPAGDWGMSAAVSASDGSVWLTESLGIIRLDPASGDLQSWDVSDDIGLDGDVLAPARAGGVWLAGPGRSIRRVVGGRIVERTRLPAQASYAGGLAEGEDGTLWAATNDGLYAWGGREWSRAAGQEAGVSAESVVVDDHGAVWISRVRYPGPTVLGVARFEAGSWTVFTKDVDGRPLPAMWALAAAPGRAIWAATRDGLARYDGSAWTVVTGADLGAAEAWTPAVAPDGDVWAVTSYTSDAVRVVRLHDGVWTRWGPESGLPIATDETLPVAASLAVPPGGPVVVTPSAVYRLEGGRWEVVREAPSPVVPNVRTIVPGTGLEGWWLASDAEGTVNQLWREAPGGPSRVPLPPAIHEVAAIAVAADGSPWLATDAGVATTDAGRVALVDARPAVGVTVAADGTVWAMADDSSLRTIRRDDEGWVVEDMGGRVDGMTIRAGYGIGPTLVVAGDGAVWANGGEFGYDHAPGLRRFAGGVWVEAGPDAASTSAVRGRVYSNLSGGPDGTVWVTMDGTADEKGCCTPRDRARQVAHWVDGGWTVYGVAEGLPDAPAGLSLAVTPDGIAWASADVGIFRFDGARWRLAISDWRFGQIVAGRDGSLWLPGAGIVRIATPPR